MSDDKFENVFTIGNGDEQLKLFRAIRDYSKKNKFLVAYDSKPIINTKYLDRIVVSSKDYYVCISKEYIKNAPRQFIAPNHIAKIINKQTGQNYLFRGAVPEELFEMFFKIYNTQNGR